MFIYIKGKELNETSNHNIWSVSNEKMSTILNVLNDNLSTPVFIGVKDKDGNPRPVLFEQIIIAKEKLTNYQTEETVGVAKGIGEMVNKLFDD